MLLESLNIPLILFFHWRILSKIFVFDEIEEDINLMVKRNSSKFKEFTQNKDEQFIKNYILTLR